MDFTIIIPAYNAEATLVEALESARLQTLYDEHYEILVVEDGSTDGTLDLLKSMSKKIDNLRIIENQKNVGTGYSRNRAIDEASGEYITCLDADDILRSDALEHYRLVIQKSKPDIVYSNCIRTELMGNVIPISVTCSLQRHMLDDYKKQTFKGNRGFAACAVMYRKDFLISNKVKFTEKGVYEDIEFVTRAVLWANKVESIEETLYYWRLTDNSNTTFTSLPHQKISDAISAIERIPAIMEEHGSLDIFYHDWCKLVFTFLPITQRRLNSVSTNDKTVHELHDFFVESIKNSLIFNKFGLTDSIINSLID